MRTPLINVEFLDIFKNMIEYSKTYTKIHPFNIWIKQDKTH